MKRCKWHLVLFCFLFLFFAGWVHPDVYADVEWNVQSTLNLKNRPLDITSSADGKWIYILTPGEVLIYSQAKKSIVDRIPVDKGVSQITVLSRRNQLFATNQKKKTVTVIDFDFIIKIDVKGSYFKGPADAPVVIAVFEDFQ